MRSIDIIRILIVEMSKLEPISIIKARYMGFHMKPGTYYANILGDYYENN